MQLKKYYQNEGESPSIKMAIILTVPVDQPYVQFMYATSKPNSTYRKIEFTTFVQCGKHERVLVYIAKRFFLFSKYGEFICNVSIDEDAEDLGIYAF
jgi:hypothetical protein